MSHDATHLLASFRRHWRLILATVGFSLLAAAFEGVGLGLLIPFLQTLSAPDAETFRTGWAWADQHILGAGGSQLERTYRICGFILVAAWCRAGFGYLCAFFGMKARALVVEDLRMRVVDQLTAMALRFFSEARAGEIMNSLTVEMTRLGQSLSIGVKVLTRGSLLVVYVGFMLWISPALTLGVLFFFVLLSFGLTRLIARIRTSGEKITAANGAFTSLLSDFLGGIRTVTAFGMEAHERHRLERATERIARAVIETTRRGLLVQPLSQAVVSTVLLGVIVLATQFLVLPGALDVALLLTFLFALLRLMPMVHELNQQRGQWAVLRGALTNIAALLRRDDKPYLADGTRPCTGFRKAVVFEDVSFAYVSGEPVLERIDLQIACGRTTALVGASGAGKSTLVDLITRFHDPTHGRILLDGTDLRSFTLASLRHRIAIVSQDTYLFHDTVRANLAYGNPEADDRALVEAARQANALGFIEALPEGVDTVLGDRGIRLSGGERQRLAIARALLRDPDVLILDEATSALDSISEALVQESLEHLMRGRTVIAIAHRLATIQHADRVVVLEDGRVVEAGSYAELIARRGKLWEYHARQFHTPALAV